MAAGVSVLLDSPKRSALLNHEPATNLGAISPLETGVLIDMASDTGKSNADAKKSPESVSVACHWTAVVKNLSA
jgi:hypothetical protein